VTILKPDAIKVEDIEAAARSVLGVIYRNRSQFYSLRSPFGTVQNKTLEIIRLAEPRNLRALSGTKQYTSGKAAGIHINAR
jgi:hypothetical protein